MTTKQHKYSASHFREPLLEVLGELTSSTAFQPINCKDTYGPVCAKLGITADEFGTQEASGKLWVHQWIGWAFRALKKNGETTAMDSLGVKFRRGYWALTPKGLGSVPAGDDDSAPAQQVLPPVVIEDKPVVPTISDPYADAYLRKLAIDQTKCYGQFSRQAPACTTCLLRSPCSQHFLAKLSALAVEINKRIISLKGRPMPKAAAPSPPPSPAPAAPTAPPTSSPKRRTTTSAFDTRCNRCGDAIKKGDEMVWVQTTGRGDGGTFHTACAP
jgi:hypothetical protein